MKVNKLTNVDFDKIVMLGIEEVWGFSRANGELIFGFDQIKSGELSGANDTSYAEGKRGVRLATLKTNKTSSFTCENGYIIMSALAQQLGTEVEEASSSSKITVTRAEHIAVVDASSTKTLTLGGTPKGASLKIYSTNSDKTKKALVSSEAYSISGTKVTLSGSGSEASAEAGDIYLCTYEEEVEVAKRIVNDGESFSEDVRLVINMLGQDICSGVQYLVQCIMPKASVSGEWSLSLGNDPAVHNFSAEASLDVCSTDNELCEFIVC